jgi:hypothetical protein
MANHVTAVKVADAPGRWAVQLNGVEVIAFTGPDARTRAEAEAATLERRLQEDGRHAGREAPQQPDATAGRTSTEQ